MKLKSLPGVKGLHGDGALRIKAPQPPDVARNTGYATVNYDEELQRWVWVLGGGPDAVKLAKQARAKQKEYPFGTFPELLALVWLDAKGVPYLFQPYVAGGRNRAGGVVPDILIPQGGGWLVISIIGVFWHEHRQNDLSDRVLILASTVQGLPVEAFVIIVETDLYDKLDEVMTAALNNIEWHSDYS